VITEAAGVPLTLMVTPANCHDSVPAMALLDQAPRLNLHKGHRRLKALLGDAAYGTPRNMEGAKARKVLPLLSKPGKPHGSGLGKLRWVVERTLTWFCYRRR
jgi:hypothetical protein